jgi:hypothetical protein
MRLPILPLVLHNFSQFISPSNNVVIEIRSPRMSSAHAMVYSKCENRVRFRRGWRMALRVRSPRKLPVQDVRRCEINTYDLKVF